MGLVAGSSECSNNFSNPIKVGKFLAAWLCTSASRRILFCLLFWVPHRKLSSNLIFICSDRGAVIAYSVYRLATGWTTEESSSSPSRIKNFLFFTSSIQAVGSTQSPIQWVPEGYFSWGWRGRGMNLTTDLQLVSRSRKRRSIHPLSLRLYGVVLN
jgi:hypothetical protein